MDPKQNNQPLDPKLQEVYDRVMGTDLSGNSVAASAAPTNSSQTPSPVAPIDPAMTPTPTSSVSNTTPSPMISIGQDNTQIPPTTNPSMDTPSVTPPMPQTPQPINATPDVPQQVAPSDQPNTSAPVADPMPVTDSMSATLPMPQITHQEETIKIGTGGSPVAAVVKPKGKGISPVLLIVGAFVFLLAYAVFWVRFFGYSLPFLK